MSKMQPALRDYLTKLREEAYIDIKPGYMDTGASPNETKPIYTTASAEAASAEEERRRRSWGFSEPTRTFRLLVLPGREFDPPRRLTTYPITARMLVFDT